MNRVCEVANRVQLMSRSWEHADWLSLAYFHCSFLSFCPFYLPPSLSLPSFSPLFPNLSCLPLSLGVNFIKEYEWVSTLEAVNTLSTPAERWHLDVLDSKLLLFHDATRCNYSNIFALYPAAPATVKRRSWWDPGGAETSVSQSLPDLCKDRLTDGSEVGGQSAKRK